MTTLMSARAFTSAAAWASSRYICRVNVLVGGRDNAMVPMPGCSGAVRTDTNSGSIMTAPARSPRGFRPHPAGLLRIDRRRQVDEPPAILLGEDRHDRRNAACHPSTSATDAPAEETASSCDQVGGSRKLRRSVKAAIAAAGVCHPDATASVLLPSASCPPAAPPQRRTCHSDVVRPPG